MEEIDKSGGPTLENLAARPYITPDPEHIADTERLLLFSYLAGMDHASTPLNLAEDDSGFNAIPFDEAIRFMQDRVPMTKPEWEALEKKLRSRAFTVAALAEPDAIERVRQHTLAALEKGTPLSEFWIASKAESTAGIGDSPWYWETVYRTNIQTAYNAGRAAEFKRNQPEYLEFVGIEDSRQTSICRQRSGTILPATHPFWEKNWPPLHFNCRSTVRGVYKEEVDTLRSESAWKPTPEEKLPKGVAAKGFGGNPLKSGTYWQLTKNQIHRALKYGVLNELNKMDSVVAEYDVVWTDYSRTEYPGGGWVDLPDTPPSDYKAMKPAIELLSAKGHKIKVLREYKNVPHSSSAGNWKNPDFMIDGIITDLKSVQSPSSGAIKDRLDSAVKQNLRVAVLQITDSMDEVTLKRALKGYMSHNKKMERVIILYRGEVYDLSKGSILALDFGF